MTGVVQAEPKLFISYSWTTPDHEAWVLKFAEELISQGIEVILDKWDLQPGHDANAFMEKMVTDPTVNKVLLVCDEMYAKKSDGRTGGAGTEAQIITPEIYANTAQDKFAAVVRERDRGGKALLPVYYKSRIYFDLTDPSTYVTEFDKIVRWAWGHQVHVRPTKGGKPSFLEGKTVSGKIVSSASHRRAMEAVRSGSSNAVAVVREYLEIISAGLEDFRIMTSPETGQTFDDVVLSSIEEFTPYRNEMVELFAVIAQNAPSASQIENLRRFFERCIPYFESQGAGGYTEWDFDNFKFISHELFLYCIAMFLKYEEFSAAQEFLDNEYYWDDRRERENKMQPFTVFRNYLKSIEHRNRRLELRRISVHSDLLKQRSVGTGVDFNYVMTADFVLYVRGISVGDWRRWWPETLLYANRYAGPFEMFARAKSSRYFERIKGLLGVSSKEVLENSIIAELGSDRVPRWDFHKLEVLQLLGLKNLATVP